MQPRLRVLCGVIVVLTAVPAVVASGRQALPLRSVGDVALGGRSPRFDYQTIDPTTGRLYIAHQGDGRVLVVDLAGRRVAARIGGLAGVHGGLVAPPIHPLYAPPAPPPPPGAVGTPPHPLPSRHTAG